MSAQKLFFIALALIAVLYGIATYIGARQSGTASSSPTSAPWAQHLEQSLLSGPRTRLAPADVLEVKPQLAHLDGPTIVVPQGLTLSFQIAPSTQQTIRRATFTLTLGGTLAVKWVSHGTDGTTMTVPLHAGKAITLTILEQGGDLDLTCDSGAGKPPTATLTWQ